MRTLPTSARSIVNTLEVRSQRASFFGTSMLIRTLASSPSSMPRTRPIAKPLKLSAMPTFTPLESSVTSTTRWVFSNTPRA